MLGFEESISKRVLFKVYNKVHRQVRDKVCDKACDDKMFNIRLKSALQCAFLFGRGHTGIHSALLEALVLEALAPVWRDLFYIVDKVFDIL